MTAQRRIIERGEGHYQTKEFPFGRTYDWQPAYIVLECDCGEKLTLTATSPTNTCRRCQAEHSASIYDMREREGQRTDAAAHPWRHDTPAQDEQHLRDEASYPKDSPWRYNDVTTRELEENPHAPK